MNNRIIDILSLELKTGCNDNAVNGGLNNLLANLAKQQNPTSPIIQIIAMLPFAGYSSLDITERKKWLTNAINLLTSSQKFHQKPKKKKKTAVKKIIVQLSNEEILKLPIKEAQLGIRSSTISSLNKLGIESINHALMFFPYRYTDFSETVLIANLEVGKFQTVRGSVISSKVIRMGRGGRLKSTEIIIKDEANASMRILWFNQGFIATYIKKGYSIALSGKVKVYKGQVTFDNPEYELINNQADYVGKILPTYHLTKGLAQKTMKNFSAKIVEKYSTFVQETLPEEIRNKYNYPLLKDVIRLLHYPNKINDVYEGQKRIAFDELLGIQLAVINKKIEAAKLDNAVTLSNRKLIDKFISTLPFDLTNAQENANNTIMKDLQSSSPMSRLLEGDVGSGKTVVALCAMLAIISSNSQAVIMAPTEILAEQHFKTILKLLTGETELALFGMANTLAIDVPVRVVVLTGSMTTKEKNYALELIQNGTANIIIGTHALIQENVAFKNLGLIVIDEQHRFGVMQRAELKNKADKNEADPHILVMTATPIPRSLALTVYGDLELTIIDEMPKGRQKIKTKLLQDNSSIDAFKKIKDEIKKGNQAFIICPLVQESEHMDHEAAISEHKRLQEIEFPEMAERIGLLHGKMKGKEKELIMKSFEEKKLDILVATSVIEVGIDIPDATVIIIEGADRFGLAQLHQLRGRVGRSNKESFCYLIANDSNEESELRLKTFASINDGFELAEADLKIRGPGEIYGTKQSGLPNIRIASLLDARLIDRAKKEATAILENNYVFSANDKKKIAELTKILSSTTIHEIH